MLLLMRNATIPQQEMQVELQGPGPEFESFVCEYGERAFQFAYRLGGNVEEAKELVQEAFVRMFRNWERFDRSRSMSAWYFRILRNVFLDGRRRYERKYAVSIDRRVSGEAEDFGTYGDALEESGEAPFDALAREENAREVRAALAALSFEHRAILSLVDMEASSYEEVGRVLDIPLGTVRSRVARARSAFRRSFERAWGPPA